MIYYSKKEIEDSIQNNETIILNDEIISKMIDGELDNYVIREGLCGRDLSDWDFSGVTNRMFAYLSFDSDTIFPINIQPKVDKLLEDSKAILSEIELLHQNGITGKGTNIAIIDTPFDISQFGEKLTYYQMDNVDMEEHGITVTSIISQIVPESNITFLEITNH